MVTFTLLVTAAVVSFLAMRSSFAVMKFVAGMAWWALGIWWITNPIVTAGSPTHVAILVILFGLGLIIPFIGLGTEYRKEENGVTSGGFKFQTPKWLKGEDEEVPALSRQDRHAIYSQRVARGLRKFRR